jgi:hypothetical protein
MNDIWLIRLNYYRALAGVTPVRADPSLGLPKYYTARPLSPDNSVRREKALVHSGWKSRPGTGSFRAVAIEAAVEVTKPLKPSAEKVAMATRRACRP